MVNGFLSVAANQQHGIACANKAKLKHDPTSEFKICEDADLDNLGLKKYGIEAAEIARPLVNELTARKKVNCWIENWERICITTTNDEIINDRHEKSLLKKYGGLQFADGSTVFSVHNGKLSKNGGRFQLYAKKPSYDPQNVKQRDYEAFEIDEDTLGLIYEYMFKHEDPKIELVTREGTTDRHGKWLAWKDDTVDGQESNRKLKANKASGKLISKKKTKK